MNMLRFDAIIFDFDGVLADSVDVKTRAFAALYEPYGAEVVGKVVAWHLEHGGVTRHEKFRHFHQAFLGRTLTPSEETDLAARFSGLVEDAVIAAAWVPGAREFLEHWHRRVPLFVASGTPQTELVRIIDRRQMKNYFSAIGGAPHSKAALIKEFISAHGLVPERALMIGDSRTDLDAAVAVGTCFLGISSSAGFFSPETPVMSDLTELGDYVIFGND